MRYKIQISVPALLSTAVFVLGFLVVLFYSLEVTSRKLGSEFMITISPQTLIIYFLSAALSSFFIFAVLKRNRK